MYNIKFASMAEFMKLNSMDEKQLVIHMIRYFDNQNYRNAYNARKNALSKAINNIDLSDEKEAIAELRRLKAKKRA